MKFLTITISFFFAVTLFSCGSAAENDGSRDSSNREIVNSASPDAKGNICLLGFADKLDKLLTMEMAAEAAGLPAQQARVKYFNSIKNSANHSITYLWKSERTRDMKDFGMSGSVPVSNRVELHGIVQMSLRQFRMSHRSPSKQELGHTEKALNKAFDKKSGNKKIDEQVDKLDQMKVDKSTQKSVAGKMSRAFAQIGAAYQDIDGLGEAASWNAVENRIYVLERGVLISLTVDLSAEESFNKQKAIELVKAVLRKCH